MSFSEKHSEASTAFEDQLMLSQEFDKLSKSAIIPKSLSCLSPRDAHDYSKPKSLEDSHFSYTVKKGAASSMMANSLKDLGSIKNSIVQLQYKESRHQVCLNKLKNKFKIQDEDADITMSKIISRVDQLLDLEASMKEEVRAKDAEILNLKIKCEDFERLITELEQRCKDSHEETMAMYEKVLPMVTRSQEFLSEHEYIFKKSTLAAITKGMKLRPEDMASIDKVHLDYKQGKVIVEYLVENQSEAGAVNDGSEISYNLQTKSLLEANIQLLKHFGRNNNFLLCNITDLYRFNKDRGLDPQSIVKICKALDVREKEFSKMPSSIDKTHGSEHNSAEKNYADCSSANNIISRRQECVFFSYIHDFASNGIQSIVNNCKHDQNNNTTSETGLGAYQLDIYLCSISSVCSWSKAPVHRTLSEELLPSWKDISGTGIRSLSCNSPVGQLSPTAKPFAVSGRGCRFHSTVVIKCPPYLTPRDWEIQRRGVDTEKPLEVLIKNDNTLLRTNNILTMELLMETMTNTEVQKADTATINRRSFNDELQIRSPLISMFITTESMFILYSDIPSLDISTPKLYSNITRIQNASTFIDQYSTSILREDSCTTASNIPRDSEECKYQPEPKPRNLNILVHHPNGGTMNLILQKENMDNKTLFETISYRSNIPVHELRLIYRTKEIKHPAKEFVSDLKLEDGSTIDVRLRLKGGSTNQDLKAPIIDTGIVSRRWENVYNGFNDVQKIFAGNPGPIQHRKNTFDDLDSEAIYNCLKFIFPNDEAHIVPPGLASISNIFSSNADSANDAISNLIMTITDFKRMRILGSLEEVRINKVPIDRPIIYITSTACRDRRKNAVVTSELESLHDFGSHWVSIVIVPNNFKGLSEGNTNPTQNEQVYLFDSIATKRTLPINLKDRLINDWKRLEESEQGRVKNIISQLYPAVLERNAEFHEFTNLTTQNHNSCGYWAMFNAIMLVLTGRTDFYTDIMSKSKQNGTLNHQAELLIRKVFEDYVPYIYNDKLCKPVLTSRGTLDSRATKANHRFIEIEKMESSEGRKPRWTNTKNSIRAESMSTSTRNHSQKQTNEKQSKDMRHSSEENIRSPSTLKKLKRDKPTDSAMKQTYLNDFIKVDNATPLGELSQDKQQLDSENSVNFKDKVEISDEDEHHNNLKNFLLTNSNLTWNEKIYRAVGMSDQEAKEKSQSLQPEKSRDDITILLKTVEERIMKTITEAVDMTMQKVYEDLSSIQYEKNSLEDKLYDLETLHTTKTQELEERIKVLEDEAAQQMNKNNAGTQNVQPDNQSMNNPNLINTTHQEAFQNMVNKFKNMDIMVPEEDNQTQRPAPNQEPTANRNHHEDKIEHLIQENIEFREALMQKDRDLERLMLQLRNQKSETEEQLRSLFLQIERVRIINNESRTHNDSMHTENKAKDTPCLEQIQKVIEAIITPRLEKMDIEYEERTTRTMNQLENRLNDLNKTEREITQNKADDAPCSEQIQKVIEAIITPKLEKMDIEYEERATRTMNQLENRLNDLNKTEREIPRRYNHQTNNSNAASSTRKQKSIKIFGRDKVILTTFPDILRYKGDLEQIRVHGTEEDCLEYQKKWAMRFIWKNQIIYPNEEQLKRAEGNMFTLVKICQKENQNEDKKQFFRGQGASERNNETTRSQ